MAEKLLTPNIPKLEMVKVPPVNSSGFSLLSLARPAMSLISVAISYRPFRLVFLSTGAISPWSVCTATDMLTFLNCLTKSSIQEELVSGTLVAAREAALMTMSLTEILDVECLFSLPLSAISLSIVTDTVT